MPELPEVETVRRGLEPHLLGRRIAAATVRQPRLRWTMPRDFAARVRGRRVQALARRSKYLIADLGDERLLLHLGMSGRIYWFADAARAPAPGKHDHWDLKLDDGGLLRFHDPRRFGATLLWKAGAPPHALLKHLGPEPFSDDFNPDYLFRSLRGRKAPIKALLMDAGLVVGVGNIYASESLFRAGIRPRRAAGRLTRAECEKLVAAVRAVLSAAIEKGGTTLRDSQFTDAHGAYGDFQVRLNVYDRAGQPCRVCRTPIRRVATGTRSTYFCARCQR